MKFELQNEPDVPTIKWEITTNSSGELRLQGNGILVAHLKINRTLTIFELKDAESNGASVLYLDLVRLAGRYI